MGKQKPDYEQAEAGLWAKPNYGQCQTRVGRILWQVKPNYGQEEAISSACRIIIFGRPIKSEQALFLQQCLLYQNLNLNKHYREIVRGIIVFKR